MQTSTVLAPIRDNPCHPRLFRPALKIRLAFTERISFMPAAASPTAELAPLVQAARDRLDAHVYETVQWHFHPSTGCPFWLEKAGELKFDPLKDVKTFDDLKKFPEFQDEWLRGGPVRRWVPKAFADKPVYVFETGGTTGTPKSRIAMDDFRTDYSLFSDSLPDNRSPISIFRRGRTG
jgi:hypothetical protein